MTFKDQIHLRRHGVYEKKFSKAFRSVLKQNYYQIARNLENGLELGEVDSDSMYKAYERLYLQIMATEGSYIWNELVAPITGERVRSKDVFDEIANVFRPSNISEMKPFWNKLMKGFLNTYIAQRVTEVMGTTIRRIKTTIEKGRNDGLTDKELARMIRADERARELRANTIARTEATTAMNKSWILSLESSGLNWEKAWNAIRDDRTREDHWLTDPSLWIGVKDNFIIGGWQMSFPGDSTQGAPVGEIINCRCWLKFRLAGRQYGFRPKQ